MPLTSSLIGVIRRTAGPTPIRTLVRFHPISRKRRLCKEVVDAASTIGGIEAAAHDPTFLNRLERRLEKDPELMDTLKSLLTEPHDA